jgi:hypothetical protein
VVRHGLDPAGGLLGEAAGIKVVPIGVEWERRSHTTSIGTTRHRNRGAATSHLKSRSMNRETRARRIGPGAPPQAGWHFIYPLRADYFMDISLNW